MIKPRLIGELRKNTFQDVRVHLHVFQKRVHVSVRIWDLKETGEASTMGRAGFSISARELPELIRILQRAQEIIPTFEEELGREKDNKKGKVGENE
jgi:hypothetical protein